MKKTFNYQALPAGFKLQFIGLSTLAVSILLSTSILITNDYRTSKALMQTAMQTLAQIVADASATALYFDDELAAKESLATLRASGNVQYAELITSKQQTFARYEFVQTPSTTAAQHLLQLNTPITLNGNHLGELVMHYDPSPVESRFIFRAGISLLLALLMIQLAFVVMRHFIRNISAPLNQLAQLIARVTNQQDYSLRSDIHSDDEIGKLAQGLDGMLAHINTYRQAELQRSQDKLATSENRYNTLVESVQVGVAQMNRRAEFVFANRIFWHITGVSDNNCTALTDLFFVHPDYRGTLSLMFKSALAGRHEPELEFRLTDRDGDEFWVSIEINPLFDPTKNICGAVSTWLDITQRKRDEAELRLAASVFEASHESIIITNSSGKIVSVNRAFSRINEYSKEEVIGLSPDVLSAGSTSAEVYQQLWDSLHQQGEWNGELLNRRKGGESYPSWTSIAAVLNDKGETLNYVSITRDITGMKEKNKHIQHLAHYDGLTNLPNHTLFFDRAQGEINRAQRDNIGFAVIFIDLDHFKWVNDTFGHAIGDALLQEVGRRLQAAVRSGDTVSRFGGDEFVLLLTGVNNPDMALTMGNKLLTALGGDALCNGHQLNITPSIGISLWGSGNKDIEELVREADEAMYCAKQAGRNCCRLWQPNSSSELQGTRN